VVLFSCCWWLLVDMLALGFGLDMSVVRGRAVDRKSGGRHLGFLTLALGLAFGLAFSLAFTLSLVVELELQRAPPILIFLSIQKLLLSLSASQPTAIWRMPSSFCPRVSQPHRELGVDLFL
jgi:hypothetical protein